MVKSQLIQQLDYLFKPKSVAIVGASNTFGKWGFGVFSQLWSRSGNRKIYPVNKKETEVFGVKSYNSIIELPQSVDLVVMAVPAREILDVIRSCATKGVKAVIIISAGFAEAGGEGTMIEQKIVDIAQSSGMRILGPNCIGHLNAATDLSTLLATPSILKGNIGLIAQSGNLGAQVLQMGSDMGVGFSKFVGTGNEADLQAEDFIEYLAEDEETKVIAAYIEGLREPERFFRIAQDVTRRKPIVVMKAGRTEVGVKAAKSHTGALSGSDVIYRAALKQAGVIMVEEIEELVEVIACLSHQPLPRGKRVGILTAGGGFGVVAADTCQKMGLEIAQLSSKTIEKLDALLPPYWSGVNPVDMAGSAGFAYPCLEVVLEDENVDAVLALSTIGVTVPLADVSSSVLSSMKQHVVKTLESREEDEIRNTSRILEQINNNGKPVIVSYVLSDVRRNSRIFKFLQQNGIYVYPSVQRATRALAHISIYSEYLHSTT